MGVGRKDGVCSFLGFLCCKIGDLGLDSLGERRGLVLEKLVLSATAAASDERGSSEMSLMLNI